MADEDIRVLLDKICAQRRRNHSALLRKYNLHVGQDHALCELWKKEGITQLELSERMGCEPPTITNMIKKLEEYGLVYRQRDPVDGRINRIYLTSEGKALQQPIQEVWEKQQEKLLEGTLPEERLLLRRILQQMLENIS